MGNPIYGLELTLFLFFFFRASMPVQWFLAYRIKILSHSWIVFGTIFVLSLAQGGCGIAGGVLATLLSKCVE